MSFSVLEEEKHPVGFINLSNQEAKEKQELENQLKTLEEALLLLKPKQKNCIELFYLQNKSYQEISVLTGYELKKIKSAIQNGKRNLELIMTKSLS